MDNVKEALKILIQGESEAVELYSQFSIKAAAEGFLNVSLLFKALMVAERIHIKNHKNALGEDFIITPPEPSHIADTLQNLQTAITGEMEENKTLYPRLVKSIKKDCSTMYGKVARLSMVWAQKVEKEHAVLLKLALKAVSKGEDVKFDTISICEVCGNVALDKTDDKECNICGHDSVFFKSLVGDKP